MFSNEIGAEDIRTHEQDRHLGRREGILNFALPLRATLDLRIVPYRDAVLADQRLSQRLELFQPLSVFVTVTDKDFVSRHFVPSLRSSKLITDSFHIF